MKKEIFLCSISNVSSGNCAEDCKYCTQSVHYKTQVQTYKFKSIETIIHEARALKRYGMLGFCLVTSGRGLDSDKCEYIARVAHALKNEDLGLHLIACCGRADRDSLRYLKEHGLSLIHISEPTRQYATSRMPSSA